MNRQTRVAIALGLALLAVGVALIVTKGRVRPTAGYGTTSPTETASLRSSSEVRSLIEHAFSGSGQLAPLSDEQRAALIDRQSDLISVRATGSVDDYTALMQHWGGRFVFDLPGYEREAERQRGLWAKPDSPFAVTKLFFEEATARIVNAGPEGDLFRHGSNGSTTVAIAYTQFRFRQDVFKMATDDPVSLRVSIPAQLKGGSKVMMEFSWFWIPEEKCWLPFSMNMAAKKDERRGVALPILFF
ncbi:MAG TPA: hypothetical protein VG797_06890 [Phycisphaerales bacterium]|nr:hypothetical protein [Phycisphaerales bacterium]